MSSSVFTFRPSKDKLLPFQRRFSKRETTVRKWTFVRDPDSKESVNKRRSEVNSRLDQSSVSKIPVPTVLNGVVLPSSTPEGSEDGSELDHSSPTSNSGSDINTKTLKSRTKQTIQNEDNDEISSSSDVKTTTTGTLNSTFNLSENSNQSEILRRSPRKRPYLQENNESEKSNKSEILRQSPTKRPYLKENIESKKSNQSEKVSRSPTKRPYLQESESEKSIQSESEKPLRKRPQQTINSLSEKSVQSVTLDRSTSKITQSDIESPKKRPYQKQDIETETKRSLRKRPQEGGSEILRSLRKRPHDKQDLQSKILIRSESPRRSLRKRPIQTVDRSPEKAATPAKMSEKIRQTKLEGETDKRSENNSKQNNKDSVDNTKIASINQSIQDKDRISDKANVDGQSSLLNTTVSSPNKHSKGKFRKASDNTSEDTVSPERSKNAKQALDSDEMHSRQSSRLTQGYSVTSIDVPEQSLTQSSVSLHKTLENSSEQENVDLENGDMDLEVAEDLIERDKDQLESDDIIGSKDLTKSVRRKSGTKKHVSTAINPVDISYDKSWKNTSLAKSKGAAITVNVSRDSVTENSMTSNKMTLAKNMSEEENEDLTEDNHVFSESQESGQMSREDIFNTSEEEIVHTNTRNSESKSSQQLNRNNNLTRSLTKKYGHDHVPPTKQQKAVTHKQYIPENIDDFRDKQMEDEGSNSREISHGTEHDEINTDDEGHNDRGQGRDKGTDNTGKPVELESILVTSDTPRRKSPGKNVVKKKVRIVSGETESVNKEQTIKMWKGHDENRTSGDVIDLDIVMDKVTDIIEEHRSACGNSSGKKALNSLLVYTRKEITEMINKIEDIKYDKKELSGTRSDVKSLRGRLLSLQQEKSSLSKEIKAKKRDEKTKLKNINQWFIGMTELMKVKKNQRSPRKVEYTTYGNFPLDINL